MPYLRLGLFIRETRRDKKWDYDFYPTAEAVCMRSGTGRFSSRLHGKNWAVHFLYSLYRKFV